MKSVALGFRKLANGVLFPLLALLALWSLVSKLMPAFPQRNLPWILFALPAWLGVLAGAWLMRDRTPRARPG